MKIMHILAQLPSNTGSGVYYSNVIKGFSNEHEQACIFAYQGDYEFKLVAEEHQFPVVFKTPDLPFEIVGMSDVMPYPNTLYSAMTEEMIIQWQTAFKATIQKAVDQFQPDILICHHLWKLTAMVRAMYPEKKIIGVCHGTDIRQSGQSPVLKDKYVTNIHELDNIFALSALQVPDIMQTYSVAQEKITVIGGGFDHDIFYPPVIKERSNKTIRLIYAGKIAASKGVYELIEAFALALEAKPHLHLAIIGSRDSKSEEILAEALQGKQNITVYNVASQQALGEAFRQADIFMLPSYYEGLGLVAIESLACGMRVVSTEIDGLMSLLGDEVNKSGVIEYIKLPRLHNVDEPLEEDIPAFKQRLADAILIQADRIEQQQEIPTEISNAIQEHSWKNILRKMNTTITSHLE